MTWHAARAANQRPLPKPRKNHGEVTAIGLDPQTVRNVVAADNRNDRACTACGYVMCDVAFHNILPDGWAVSGGTHCTHLETGAAVWCGGRSKWGYVHRQAPVGKIDGWAHTRARAMACAIWPYAIGMLPRAPEIGDYWLRQHLRTVTREDAQRMEIIARYGLRALAGPLKGAMPLPMTLGHAVLSPPAPMIHPTCCLTCGRLRLECKC